MSTPTEELLATLAEPWPLVGRDQLIAATADVLRAPGSAAFLHGDAGCGKTRLAAEALEVLSGAGWSTARATATDASRPVPLGALAHLIPVAAADATSPLVVAVQEALGSRTAEDPLILHVDDAQHLDPSSGTLLASLVASGSVRLLITARTGTVLLDALLALRADPGTHSIKVPMLAEPEVHELLDLVLGARVDGLARAQVWNLSQGNPLYLRELVIGGVADGSLHQVAGVWQLAGALPTTQPLADRVLGRLGSLSEDARSALELVAIGQPLGLGLLESITAPEPLEELEQAGLIQVVQERRRDEVTVAHPIYGEVIRSAMGADRQREHAARLVDATEASGTRRSSDSGRLVSWQLVAGLDPDPERALESARVARHHNDWLTAVRLARVAYDGGLDDAAYLLAESHYALGEFDDGDLIAEPALAEPGRLSDGALTGLHRTRAGVWFFGSTPPERAFESVAAAADKVTDPDLLDMLGYARAAMCMWSGRVREARTLAEPLLEAPDPKVRVQAAIAVETVAATAGPATRAIELADHWFGVHAGLPDLNGTNSPAFHLLVKTEALVNAGWFDDADGLAEFGYQLSVTSLNRIAQMWFARQLGRIALYRGAATTARMWFQEMVALCRGTAWLRPLALGLSDLAMAEAHLGNAAAAKAAIDERDDGGVPVVELFTSEGVRGTAWAMAAAGDRQRAQDVLRSGAEAAEAEGIVLLGALARVDALRLGAADQAEALTSAAAVVGSRTVELAARWASSPGDGEELEAVAAGFEEIGCLLHAAEVLGAASRAWRADGQARRATGVEHRTSALLRRCAGGEAATVSAGSDRVALTPREQEIADLVANGMTSKAAAAQLHLSARTVSNHLQSVYAKLGVSGRGELAEALADLELGHKV